MSTINVDKIINESFNRFSADHYKFFRKIGSWISSGVEAISDALKFITPIGVVILILLLIVFISKKRSAVPSIKVSLFFLIIYLLGYWDETMTSASILLYSVIVSVILGFAAGILAAEFSKIGAAVSPILDFLQTIPSFVYLIPSVMLFGIGTPSAVLSIITYSLPTMIRLTSLGLIQVDSESVESTISYGATKLQLLFITKIPMAMKSIILGVNQTFLTGLSMMITASMVGAGGVGQEVLVAINQINLSKGLRSGICIVLLAMVISTITKELTVKYDYGRKI